MGLNVNAAAECSRTDELMKMRRGISRAFIVKDFKGKTIKINSFTSSELVNEYTHII